MNHRHVVASVSRTLSSVALVAIVGMFPHGASAADRYSECLASGPDKSLAWMLRSDQSKRAICLEQERRVRAMADLRAHTADDDQPIQVASPPAPSPSLRPAPGGRTTLVAQPRITDDGRTLILLEEVRAPWNQRRPEVRVGTNENSGAPQVQIAGASVAPIRDVAISCTRSRRALKLTQFSQGKMRNVASYTVPADIASTVLEDGACHIALGGAVLPLPSEMVAIVWPSNP